MRRKKIFFLLVLFIILIIPNTSNATYGDVTTFISKIYAGDGGNKLDAYLDFPRDIENKKGNFFIADTENNVIRKINSKGKIFTYAGTGSYGDTNGDRKSAEFAEPEGVAVVSNNEIYVADTKNNKIKRIYNGTVTNIAEDLNTPEGLDIYGDYVYFLDTGSDALKKVHKSGGEVFTITSSLDNPKKIKINKKGKAAYITDSGNHKLIKVNLKTGKIINIAGNSVAGNRGGACLGHARFRNLWGLDIYTDNQGNEDLIVTDGTGNFISEGATAGIGYLWYIDTNSDENEEGCKVIKLAEDANTVSLNFPNGLTVKGDYAYIASTGISVVHRFNVLDPLDNNKFAGFDRFGNQGGTNPLLGRP